MISHSSRLPYHVFGTRRSSPDDLRCHRVVTYSVNMFQFNRFAISLTLDCVRHRFPSRVYGAFRSGKSAHTRPDGLEIWTILSSREDVTMEYTDKITTAAESGVDGPNNVSAAQAPSAYGDVQRYQCQPLYIRYCVGRRLESSAFVWTK